MESDGWGLILANPPFKGSLDADIVSTDLLKVCKTKKTELLFLALFLRMLRVGGRCACIVPDCSGQPRRTKLSARNSLKATGWRP